MKYATAIDLVFPIVKTGATDFAQTADWTPVAGDVKVSKDGGSVANAVNLPVALGGAGSALWLLTLTAAELTAKRVAVQVVDSPVKAVEDQALLVATYGDPAAAYGFDYSLSVDNVADAILRRPISGVEGGAHPFRSLYGMISKLVNRVATSGGTLTVYQTDDATPLVVQTLTRDAAATPVTEVDTP